MSNSSIRPIDRTLSSAISPGQSGPGSDSNEEVLDIPKNSSITEASQPDYLLPYTGHMLVESYTSPEIQSVYSTTPADWGNLNMIM